MNLRGILSITGMPGLYKYVAQAHNGLIIESLTDKKRSMAFARAKISALEDISMYTNDGDKRLVDIYRDLYNELKGEPVPFNPKKATTEQLVELFAKVLPDYDRDRVYISNIKTAFVWYNILQANGLVDGKDENEENEQQAEAQENEEQEQPIAKRTRTRKKASKSAQDEEPKAE